MIKAFLVTVLLQTPVCAAGAKTVQSKAATAPLEAECKPKPVPKCKKTAGQILKAMPSEEIGKSARMVPVLTVSGQIDSFRIVSLPDCGIYEALGFQQCDQLLSINGKALDTPGKIMELYNVLSAGAPAEAEVIRQGARTKIKISFE